MDQQLGENSTARSEFLPGSQNCFDSLFFCLQSCFEVKTSKALKVESLAAHLDTAKLTFRSWLPAPFPKEIGGFQ